MCRPKLLPLMLHACAEAKAYPNAVPVVSRELVPYARQFVRQPKKRTQDRSIDLIMVK